MRWKLHEFVYEMEQDAQRRVFFVEGVRDLMFWSKTLGINRRSGTVVYAISSLECASVPGGERGRLIWAANQLTGSPIANRLQFFTDADFDRLLGVQQSPNVLLTDGRDLESYFFLGNCVGCFCGTMQPAVAGADAAFLQLIDVILRPIGILRLAAARSRLRLPFRRTLQKGLSRFVGQNNGAYNLDLDALIRALLQNAGRSLSEMDNIRGHFDTEVQHQVATSNDQIVHGKDLARLISWKFGVTHNVAESFVMLALATEVQSIRGRPNITVAANWLI